ncbi:FAD-binding domain-containing protein [Pleomassaria siparia CBS 279.74]|uniref:FAD-binding domain-containing protein n=1 Tax=Pleomassaria siparia CBS 279.74 TaxID=1314801 RepID=A0A6G1JSZ5_9PLEO|nr:FAD-binding domain-containing protein [Pleomassaria siparia CBS 279.74]
MTPLLSSVILAAALMSSQSQSRTLFDYEGIQLTREYVASLSSEDAELFGFGDEAFTGLAVNTTTPRCRCAPGDGKWPSDKAWNKLSTKLSTTNALIRTIPQSSVCYGDTKNDAKCKDLTTNWSNSYSHMDDPTEILSPIYQGLTCVPPTIYDTVNCTLGGYPSYVIKASTVLDLQLGINFARNDGVRLVVKNTGHDFAGKSTGYGSLSLWTHGLKDILFIDNYADEPSYTGPAIKAGAGVQAFELYKAANDHGMVVVAGEGQTVGVMGGYIQGGGHSPLSPIYGMAADNVLGFEIITAIGDFITVNSATNPDLFWALRGGGGGTFGVVTSVTVKAYKDMPITTASWTLDSTKIGGKERLYAAVKVFIDNSSKYADDGATYSYWLLLPSADGKSVSFVMQPFFAPNKTATQTTALLSTLQTKLTSLNIPFSPKITEYKGFYAAWQAQFPLEPQSAVNTAFGSRLVPRSNFASETGRNVTFSVFKDAVEAGQPIIGFTVAPTLARGGNADNAVNPAWRTAVIHAITHRAWTIPASPSTILATRAALTNGIMKKWRDVTPGSGSYLNEADRTEPNWQQSFWGDKYAKLLAIKNDWDPKTLFWVNQGVGSEGWVVESVDGLPNENGRLCLVNKTTTMTTTTTVVAAGAEEDGTERILRAF